MARRDDTPRDLLFGLLALQNGLIDQDQLVAAFGAWSRAKGKTLAEILLERGSIDAESRALLAAMAEKQLKLHGGDTEKSLASIGAGPSTREGLTALGDTDLTASLTLVGSHTPPQDATFTMSVGTATSDGQRFRVLRPHARGGLGAVFVALDAELNREVALKQILDHHADDPLSRTRFLIEAEITGGLEHPGIVPVYGLGHHADGRPYYAMRFIRGDSLKEAIAGFHGDGSLKVDPGKRSLALRKLLRRFVDVCNAIDYAHGRGVLHRDLKPGNVIVGKHGETLVVDWGLAKPMGHAEVGGQSDERTLMPSSSSGSAETLPGSAIGTPSYMSPEQAAGDLGRLGPRSDVYSLGATLYCLLTGKAPFEGTDLGTLLREVQEGSFPPPRQVDPSIDRALEAVCLKAMALKPEGRHATARALADDVDRWAADEPVSAWREPASARARRWMRRHRSAVTAASAAVLVALVGLAAVLAVQTRATNDLAMANGQLRDSLAREANANTSLAAANAELTRSRAAVQARYDLAVEAIKTFHTGVSEDFLLKEEAFKELRDRLLRSAADFYGKLGALLGEEADPASRRSLARSNFELADLTSEVGRKEDALAAHRAVLVTREALAAEPEAGPGAKAEVGRSLTKIAGLLAATGKTEEALTAYRRSESLLAGPAGADPAARASLAACRSGMGNLLAATGRTDEALAAYRLARADQEALAGPPDAAKEARRDLAETITSLGNLLAYTGKFSGAGDAYRQALEILQKLADDHPAVADSRSRLAGGHTSLGNLLRQSGKPSGAGDEFRKALVILQKLADDFPAVTEFRGRLADSHFSLGNLLAYLRKPSDAGGEYRQALALFQKLADDNPSVTEFRGRLADSHFSLGLALTSTGKLSGAGDEYRQALAIFQKLADDHPTVTEFRSRLALSHSNLGNLLAYMGQPSGAGDEYRKALAIRRKLADDNPTISQHQRDLASSHSRVGKVLARDSDHAAATAEYRRAVAIMQRLPATSASLYDMACYQSLLAGSLARPGSDATGDEAEAAALAAVSTLGRAIGAGFRVLTHMRADTDLDPLRSRPDFRLLMMDLAFPAQPFAR